VLRRVEENICQFLAVTELNSYENIKKFAGSDYRMAKYYPEDKNFLLEFEENVIHYETFDFNS
jgi:hypothetical protein